jgi:hypothetical protein
MNRIDMKRRALLAALLAPALPALEACGGGDGGPPPAPALPPPGVPVDGLAGQVVRRLRPSPQGLLAATDGGALVRGAQAWEPLGLDLPLRDIVALGGNTLLASAVSLQGAPLLLRSSDGGANWQALAHDFGGPQGA